MQAPISNARIGRERMRRSLHRFIQGAWHVLEPATKFEDGAHIRAVCAHLEAVSAGKIDRLLINMPPGTMKSTTVSVCWQVWEWLSNPYSRWLFLSHDTSNTIRDNRRARMLMESEWFSWVDGFRLADDQNAKGLFINEHQGHRQAGGIRGSLTGRRADRIVIDDPHDAKDVESEANRDSAVQNFKEVIPSRVNKDGSIVIVMQRIDAQDVAAEALELGYEHLCLPMEFEPGRVKRTVLGFEDWRTKDGELLWPEVYPAERVEDLRLHHGGAAYAAQYQQRPTPRGGGLIKPEWFKPGLPPDVPLHVVRFWDLAATRKKAGNRPAWTSGVKMALDGNNQVYILDVVRFRGNPLDVEKRLRATAEADGEETEQCFEQEPGSAGVMVIDNIRRRVLPGYRVRADKVVIAKELRAHAFSAYAESGNIFIHPEALEWKKPFLHELEDFPRGAYKDQVDAAAGGFRALMRNAAPGEVGVSAFGSSIAQQHSEL
jgi:predicted phage terminase large subunit-like protein